MIENGMSFSPCDSVLFSARSLTSLLPKIIQLITPHRLKAQHNRKKPARLPIDTPAPSLEPPLHALPQGSAVSSSPASSLRPNVPL